MIDYTYTAARIAAMESNLLSKEALSRITSSSDPLQVLIQTGYGKDAQTVSEAVEYELSAVRRFVMESLPQKLYPLLILPYDSHNLKVLLKCTVNGADPKPYLYGDTMFDTEIAKACCRGGEFSLLSDNIASYLNKAYDEGELTNPFNISTWCDKAFYSEISLYANSAPVPVKDYTEAVIDGKNFISYQRAVKTGLSGQDFRRVLIGGGTIPPSAFEKAFDAKASDICAYTFGFKSFDAVKAAHAKKDTASASAVFDEYCLGLLEESKYETLSPVPVFVYFKKKQIEARRVREAFSSMRGAAND